MAEELPVVFSQRIQPLLQDVSRYHGMMIVVNPNEEDWNYEVQREVELKIGVSLADLLNAVRASTLTAASVSASGTWDTFIDTFRRTLVWISPTVCFFVGSSGIDLFQPLREMSAWTIITEERQDEDSIGFDYNWWHEEGGDQCHCYAPNIDQAQPMFESLFSYLTSNTEAAAAAAVSGDGSPTWPSYLEIDAGYGCRLPLRAHVFADFLAHNPSLAKVSFAGLNLDLNMCNTLALFNRPDLVLALCLCNIDATDRDAVATLTQSCHLNLGPTQLDCCCDLSVLATALEGNTRVVKLVSGSSATHVAGLDLFARRVAFNLGLQELDLSGCLMTTAIFKVLCESLYEHPAITSLDLKKTFYKYPIEDGTMTAADRQERTEAVAALVEQNHNIVTVQLCERERNEVVYHLQIVPTLRINSYRPLVRAISRMEPTVLPPLDSRPAILGRAIFKVAQDDPSLVWLMVESNVDLLFGGGRG